MYFEIVNYTGSHKVVVEMALVTPTKLLYVEHSYYHLRVAMLVRNQLFRPTQPPTLNKTGNKHQPKQQWQ